MSAADEEQIRELVSTWHAASQAGDIDRVLSLMSEDAVFLVAGRPPMTKGEFESLSRVPAGAARPELRTTAEIRELQVMGDWAYMWADLSVAVTPPGADRPIRRAGPTLTIFRRSSAGHWQLFRDANLLTAIP